MRFLSVDSLDKVFQTLVGELIVNSVWSASHHDRHGLSILHFLVFLKLFLSENGGVHFLNCRFPDTVHVELFGVHKTFSHNHLAFKK